MQVQKRAYRAQNIKRLDMEKIIEAVGGAVGRATDIAKVDMVRARQKRKSAILGLSVGARFGRRAIVETAGVLP